MTAPHPFDAATSVRYGADGCKGHTEDRYKAFVGPYGGATAATLLRAVLDHPERLGEALAITVNYCAPVADGEFALDVRPLRTNRSTQHWLVTLMQPDGVAASATVITAIRRDPWSHLSSAPPVMPSRDSLELYQGSRSFSWIRQYRFWFAAGLPNRDSGTFEQPAPSQSRVWIQDDPPRPLDALSLVSMSDAFLARIFLAIGKIVPFGTMSITTYLHVSAEELLAAPVTEVFGVARANVFHRSFGDQTAELWLPSGQLAATSQQVTYFKT